ncbi:MAG: sugar ABC transporter substrate-binding protein [Suipraeoptans sp.]
MVKLAKSMTYLLVLIMLIGTLSACQASDEVGDVTVVEDEGIKIGITFDTFVLERWIKDRDKFVATAAKYDASVDVQNANGDVDKQKGHIKKFIEEKMDAIVVVAVDCYSLTEEINDAKAQGIKVVSYDRLIQGTKTDLYVTVDNYMVGELMAKDIKSRLPDGGNIIMICGPEADSNSIDVKEGFADEIGDDIWKIIYQDYVKAWTPENGFEAVNEAFASVNEVSEVDAVMCGNDGLAGYAIKALSELQMAGKIYVVGQDADLEACQRIVEGTQSMTVYKPIEDLARVAAESTIELINGKNVDNSDSVAEIKEMDNGTAVTYYGLEPIAVTKENMDKVIIDSSFHLKDEVYLNMQ